MAIVSVSVEAWGQASSGAQWRSGTTLAAFAGAASPTGTKPAVGTALGWEIGPHLTLEGRGVWLPEDSESTDFFAWLGALVPFKPAAAVVPFAAAGVGMYRATVQAHASDVPGFYLRRLGNRQRAIFQDVALAFGGGASVFVTSHVAIRPEVSVVLVTTRSETRTSTLYGVHLAYHFEPHETR
jgi:hypothetical protein